MIKKILTVLLAMVCICVLLGGCAAKRTLTLTLDDSAKGVEAFVTVYDKSGKEVGGGNVMSDGPLMLSVKSGTYTVEVTDISEDGYALPEPAQVKVGKDTGYVITLEKNAPWRETEAAAEADTPTVEETVTETAAETEAESPAAETQIEEEPPKGDVFFDEKEKAYADIIDLHKQAIAENWDMDQYDDHDMSFVFRNCHSEEEVGYDLMYFDDSKYPMLLMGTLTGDDFTDMMILDAYYLTEDGTLKHVLSSGERYRYYWMPDEAGPQLIAYEGSGGAATSYYYYYRVDQGELKCVQGIVYDFDADPENPSYQVYEDNFSIEGGEPVSEEYAEEITTAYAKQYKKVPYRPISDGYEMMAE